MKDPYGKGSIIYKLIIVILAGVLAFSIVYPKRLWIKEDRNMELSHYRMSQLYNAQFQYQRFNSSFTDSLDRLLTFIKSDTQYHKLVDSLVVLPIQKSLNYLDTLRQIQSTVDKLISAAQDSTVADSIEILEDRFTTRSRDVRNRLEAIRERMLDFPALPVSSFDLGLEIIERKDFFLKVEVVRRMVKEVGDLKLAESASRQALANVDSMTHHMQITVSDISGFPSKIDSLRYCPTVMKDYKVELADSGVFKFVNIYCPIDESDIQSVASDFIKSKVGAFQLANHGSIVKNEKSWEEEK